jgi:protein involved in polysaccharide export with SLBB domain
VNKLLRIVGITNFSLFLLLLSSPDILSQNITNLSDEFLEGLPPSVREQIEVQNEVNAEKEIEDLFQSDTSIEKNKVILQKLKDQLIALEKRFDDQDDIEDGLDRFGAAFFTTIQSSFMPVNVPNVSSDYLVDVGDGFNLLLTGKLADELELIVQRDGSILIPELGKVFIAGKSLSDADELVQSFIASKTVGVDSYLTLMEMRDVQVLMIGGVETVGIFTLPGGSNFLSALNAAGGISEAGSFRRIEHKRDGEILKVYDLYDIFVNAEFEFSTTLRTGDIIFVQPKTFEVPVTGGVAYPAIFEIMDGETVNDVINFAGGFSEGHSGFDYVEIKRHNLDSQREGTINLVNLMTVNLKPRDSIRVPSYKTEILGINRIEITGFVNRPGVYYLNERETLFDLINKAGGYRDGAYVYGAALFREDAVEKEKRFAQLNYSETINYIVSNIGRSNANVGREVLDFLAEELRAKLYTGRIITDFSINKIQNSEHDIVLLHNDRIIIPSLQKVVYMFGEFQLPTTLKYSNEMNLVDYIKSAGGLKDSAYKELVVIDPDGTANNYVVSRFSLLPRNIPIYPGTIVYAPKDVGKLDGIQYASTVSPILSSLALTIASLNSISD